MKVVTIIVTYNGMKWIDQCLSSIVNECEVVVVDNKSTDSTIKHIKENFPSVVILAQSENLGFGKANNIGISYALKQEAEYVFLLNQDTIAKSYTIKKLVEISNHYPDYGVISPIHLNWEGTMLESNFANYITIEKTPHLFSDFITKNNIKDIYETKFINAAAWLIPKKVLLEVGGFDPIFWHYGEDDNYCQRILFHNYKIGVVPSAFIRHEANDKEKLNNYLFSKRYFIDYVKLLQVNYANINIKLDEESKSIEKYKIIKKLLKSILKFNFYYFINYTKQYKLIGETFDKIIESRTKNQKKGSHYI